MAGKHIALYFGSFNPIHVGHLIIANHIINEKLADELWFVISPQNPLKEAKSLLNEYQRLHLVNLCIQQHPKFKASDIEFKLPKPSYTVYTLAYLTEKYPQYKFSIVMGSDSYNNLPKWKNYEIIVQQYHCIVFSRPQHEVKQILNPNSYTATQAPLLQISSSYIRQLIQQQKSISFMVHPLVEQEIQANHYYR